MPSHYDYSEKIGQTVPDDCHHVVAGGKTKAGISSLTAERFDVMGAVGGVRGILESIIPTIVFLALYVYMGSYELPALIALVACVVFVLIRLIQRISIMPALSGLGAMTISVFLAWKTGQASNIFLWGILTNLGYLLGLTASILARWPILGVVISLILGTDQQWRTDPRRTPARRAYFVVTWLWVLLFATRLIVQVPLYLFNQTEALGIAKILLGLPLFALFAWYSWAYLKPHLAVEKSLKEHSHEGQ
ncbi:DUF3159 domain-containing protein [Arcanobacterium ihumii]|uniref:DUF3159 domain-containing protein n=1 Tax=Arcanobacterium ihumii TaxID=2138162 RepID=UPI000F51D5C7|nr:DUF3159 domain-containing protein [Arcanobacterium ihumii]